MSKLRRRLSSEIKKSNKNASLKKVSKKDYLKLEKKACLAKLAYLNNRLAEDEDDEYWGNEENLIQPGDMLKSNFQVYHADEGGFEIDGKDVSYDEQALALGKKLGIIPNGLEDDIDGKVIVPAGAKFVSSKGDNALSNSGSYESFTFEYKGHTITFQELFNYEDIDCQQYYFNF